jgi:hypothetical protein
MPEVLARHLSKAIGMATIAVAIGAITWIVLVRLGRWFLKFEGATIPSEASFFEVVSRSFSRFAQRKRLAVVAVGLICIVGRAALIPILKVPAPKDHDEFSYLLAADTFAHGRLTNPTPPIWAHFESIHINMRPTYMSMYPPGQGFLLLLGEWLGHPWISVLLSAGFGCALVCWMLQGWLPPKWALLGGVLSVLQIGILSYWTNSYYCGWLPASAGALALGTLPRLRKRAQVSLALLLGLSIALLAISRPYEGLFFSLPIAGLFLFWTFRARGSNLEAVISRVIVPLVLTMASMVAFLAYYNWRVSGNAFVMPYQVNERTYAGVPLFPWEHERIQPVYHSAEMRKYYARWAIHGYRHDIARGFGYMAWNKLKTYWRFYFGVLLSVPLLAMPWVLKDRRIRSLLIVMAAAGLGLALELWSNPHYAAPLTCVFIAVVVQGMRHLRLWRWHGRRIGRILEWAIVIGLFTLDVAWVSAAAVHVNADWLYQVGNQERAAVQAQLENMPGLQLAIVHYSPSHPTFREWVYNRADIEHAKVVWARDLGPACNATLIRYFKDRHVWLVQPDLPSKITPYVVMRDDTGEDTAVCNVDNAP